MRSQSAERSRLSQTNPTDLTPTPSNLKNSTITSYRIKTKTEKENNDNFKKFKKLLENLNSNKNLLSKIPPFEKIALYKGKLIEDPNLTLKKKWIEEMKKSGSKFLTRKQKKTKSLERREKEVADLIEKGKSIRYSEKKFKILPNFEEKNKKKINFFIKNKRKSKTYKKYVKYIFFIYF